MKPHVADRPDLLKDDSPGVYVVMLVVALALGGAALVRLMGG